MTVRLAAENLDPGAGHADGFCYDLDDRVVRASLVGGRRHRDAQLRFAHARHAVAAGARLGADADTPHRIKYRKLTR